ncbi:hypothetical protein BTJ40_10505 [Microbulbifer sp. A4B17]|nr:hypothetical protein BTJ40_10505 [Microbulbifer sp. A4B17]
MWELANAPQKAYFYTAPASLIPTIEVSSIILLPNLCLPFNARTLPNLTNPNMIRYIISTNEDLTFSVGNQINVLLSLIESKANKQRDRYLLLVEFT